GCDSGAYTGCMKRADLLRDLEKLTHAERVRRLVEIGRRSLGDARLRVTLDELERGGSYERRLVLHACCGSRDAARVLRAIGDPSRSVRALAVDLATVLLDDAQVGQALDALPPAWRRPLIRMLCRRRRAAAVDAFLDRLAARGDEALGTLLA